MQQCDGKLCSILEAGIRKDIAEVKADVKELINSNSQLAILATEIKHLREDITEAKSGLNNLRCDLSEIQTKTIQKTDILILVPIVSFIVSGIFTLLSYFTGLFGAIK